MRILNRLTEQLRAKGEKDPEGMAVALLKKNGILADDGSLTERGERRDAMTAGERAIDRASKVGRHPASAYVYDSRTNRATLRNR